MRRTGPGAVLLVFPGGFNGLILPIGLTAVPRIGFAREPDGRVSLQPGPLAGKAFVCVPRCYMGAKTAGTIFAYPGS